jgi:hypothetical protein
MKQLLLPLLLLFTIVSSVFSQSPHPSKYKAIRLAAAKKTIEQLEGGK